MPHKLNNAHESVQSVLSYSSAGLGSAVVVNLDWMAGAAEQITIILACFVVAVRLMYDITRYIRYLKKKV